MNSRMGPVHSLRAKILIIVFTFIILEGSTFLLYTIITTNNYKKLRLESIERTVEFETEKVNKIISELERGAVFYALGGMLCYETDSNELKEKFAVDFLLNFNDPVGAGIWFEPYAYKKDILRAGFYAFYDKSTGIIKMDKTFFTEEYDYHNKSWYREIADNELYLHQAVWTRPYIEEGGTFSLMTTACSPVINKEGDLIAISTIDWEIEDVVKELNSIKPTENSFILLCVPEKDYIISSTRTNSAAGSSLNSIPWDINADSFSLNGITYLRFGRYMENGWLLSVQIPENEIFEEIVIQNSRFSLIIAITAILMLRFAYLLISRFINSPIKQLTSEVSQLAIGNLDTQIKIASKDELGQLAGVFNRMKNELKKSFEKNILEHAENERTKTELKIAMEIQGNMLPCVFPAFPQRSEFDLYASMVPASHVGGDFYDFYLVDNDNLAVVIADVLGKGVPAALFMVITKTLIENYSACKSPKKVLETVNKKLLEKNDAQMFVTVFMGFLNIPTGKFTYSNAGHNPPLLKKRGEASFNFILNKPCTVLAWMEDVEVMENEITLEKGDTIFLYTDGVTEAMNPQLELFSDQRLIDALNKKKDCSPKELLLTVKNEVDNFCAGAEQKDDKTMLALKIGAPEQFDSDEKLEVQANTENLDDVINFVNCILKKGGLSENLINEIDIAVEELFINIAEYAYEPGGGTVIISVHVRDRIIINFEDIGKPYNPLEHEDPDFEKSISDREIGGLGVFLVKKIMDTVEYSRIDDKNILKITKSKPE